MTNEDDRELSANKDDSPEGKKRARQKEAKEDDTSKKNKPN